MMKSYLIGTVCLILMMRLGGLGSAVLFDSGCDNLVTKKE